MRAWRELLRGKALYALSRPPCASENTVRYASCCTAMQLEDAGGRRRHLAGRVTARHVQERLASWFLERLQVRLSALLVEQPPCPPVLAQTAGNDASSQAQPGCIQRSLSEVLTSGEKSRAVGQGRSGRLGEAPRSVAPSTAGAQAL